MAFSKRHEWKVEVLDNHVFQIRRTDIVEEDGNVIASSFHRHVVNPGDDVSEECDIVRSIAPVLHTPEVIEMYKGTLDYVDDSVSVMEVERKRARNVDGTYKADDPSTPDINEAWEN